MVATCFWQCWRFSMSRCLYEFFESSENFFSHPAMPLCPLTPSPQCADSFTFLSPEKLPKSHKKHTFWGRHSTPLWVKSLKHPLINRFFPRAVGVLQLQKWLPSIHNWSNWKGSSALTVIRGCKIWSLLVRYLTNHFSILVLMFLMSQENDQKYLKIW